MLPEIIHDVNQRVADRARRREGTSVISVSPHAASPAECAIDGACDADRETAEPARERPRRIRLGDEMDVIVLDRELNTSVYDERDFFDRGSGQAGFERRSRSRHPLAARRQPRALRRAELRGALRRPDADTQRSWYVMANSEST